MKQTQVPLNHHVPNPVSPGRHSPAKGAMIPIALDTTKPVICKEDVPPTNRVPGKCPVNSIKRSIDGGRTALEEQSMQFPKKRKTDGPVQVSLDFDVAKLRHMFENDPNSSNQIYVNNSANHGKQATDNQANLDSKKFDEFCKENIPYAKTMCNATSNTTMPSTFGLANNIEHSENGAILNSNKFEINENIANPTEQTKAEVLATVITDMERGIAGMVTFAKSMPGFTDLPKEDQVLLLKCKSVLLGIYKCMCVQKFHLLIFLIESFLEFFFYFGCKCYIRTLIKQELLQLSFLLKTLFPMRIIK